MDVSPDELAGVADQFGGLTRAELAEAMENVAARQGVAFDPAEPGDAIQRAREEYYLIGVDHGDATVFAPGPVALPALPDHAEDLPHMMDVPERTIDAERLAAAARERLSADVDRALADRDAERARFLLDVCYDAEAWGPVAVDAVRERLLDHLEAE